jgi:hypothetical protein
MMHDGTEDSAAEGCGGGEGCGGELGAEDKRRRKRRDYILLRDYILARESEFGWVPCMPGHLEAGASLVTLTSL